MSNPTTVEYTHNNSGGGWWLTDDDWKRLEEAGWKVAWVKGTKWTDEDGRFLGSLADGAVREGLTLLEAVCEWEGITGQNASEEGCHCCGDPHSFVEYFDGNYVASYSDYFDF